MRLRFLVLALALLGCQHAGAPGEAVGNKPLPDSSAQVAELRKGGVEWTNGEIRAFYLKRVFAIGPANEQWKKENVPVVDRARRAFQMRHDARLLARAMMKDTAQVEVLHRRDMEKYGTPDGPAFDWLVVHEQQKGGTGDAVYEAIVESAQRTDRAVNEVFGL